MNNSRRETAICLLCIHFAACKGIKLTHSIAETHSDTEQIECSFYESKPFIPERQTATWVKNNPNEEVMREFARLGIARGMSSKSTFWTCSNCGSWGSLNFKFCPQCGAKIQRLDQALKEREV